MSRHFDRTFPADTITLGPGATTALDGGPVTVAVVFRADANNVDQGLIQARTAANENVVAVGPVSDGFVWVTIGSAFGRQTDAYASATWYLYAFTKAAGVAAVRGHRCVMDTDAWSHTNYLTLADSVNTPIDHIRFGVTFADFYSGDIAALGVWDQVLSDLAIEALRPGLGAWANANPVALWALNQTSIAIPVSDLTGGGADQTAIEGTSVQLADPPGWSYELAAPLGPAIRPTGAAVARPVTVAAGQPKAASGVARPER